jgi:hypothetical protein
VDGFSIAALVFGVIGGILLGLVFGIVGLFRTRNGQRRGRGMAIAGIVLSVMWTAVVVAVVVYVVTSSAQRDAAGEVTEGGSASFADVRVGDCVSDLPSGVQYDVDVVPCAQPHRAQVFAIYDLESGPYPGEEQAFATGETGCRERLPQELVASPQTADLQTYLYVPNEANWQNGDRQVICLAGSETAMTGDLPGVSSAA